MHQVNLAEVGLGRVAAHARTVLHRRSEVCVPLHTEAFHEPDDPARLLAELMPRRRVHRDHLGAGHKPIALINAIDATDRAPILVMLSATSRSVETTMTDRPVGSAWTS